MTNLNNDKHQNIVSFLRQNRPIPPHAKPDLEQRIMDSIQPRSNREQKLCVKYTWTIPKVIATGFLLTSVNFGIRTPRIAVEPKDLENFLVNNWNDILDHDHHAAAGEAETYWLLPAVHEPPQALSVSAN